MDMKEVSIVYVHSSNLVNTPITIALVFGLAGAFFYGIYFIHRIRRRNTILKLRLREEGYCAVAFPNGQ